MFAGIDVASERHWLARLDDAGKPIGKPVPITEDRDGHDVAVLNPLVARRFRDASLERTRTVAIDAQGLARLAFVGTRGFVPAGFGGNFGGFFGPYVTGAIAGATGSYAWALTVLGAFLSVNAVVILIVGWPERGKDGPSRVPAGEAPSAAVAR